MKDNYTGDLRSAQVAAEGLEGAPRGCGGGLWPWAAALREDWAREHECEDCGALPGETCVGMPVGEWHSGRYVGFVLPEGREAVAGARAAFEAQAGARKETEA